MQWCESEQNDFPDREFFTGAKGVLMHRSRLNGEHAAVASGRFDLPDVAEAVPPVRDE